MNRKLINLAELTLFVAALIVAIAIIRPQITGMTIGETNQTTLEINKVFNESGELHLSLQGNLTSLSISGSYSGESVEIYLDQVLVYSSKTGKTNQITGNVVGSNSTNKTENTTLDINESEIIVNATHTVELGENKPHPIAFDNECEESCLLENHPGNITLRIILNNATLNLSSVTYTYLNPEPIENTTVNVTDNLSKEISYTEFDSSEVKVGEPVTWSKTFQDVNTISIPGSAYNIQANREVKVISGSRKLSIEEFSRLKSGKPKEIKLELSGDEPVQISYQTPGPEKSEKHIDEYKKQVTISSDIHYKNVLASTEIEEAPKDSISVYWFVNNSKQRVEDVRYIDSNSDNLIDMLEWTVPHLSNQTYEISITILNPYTYLRDGESWTVAFNTTGIANLTITSPNAGWTEFLTDDSDTFDEMEFLDIKCGEESLKDELKLVDFSGNMFDYNELESDNSLEIEKLLVEDYTCDDTGYLSNYMHKAGYATLKFEYANQENSVTDYAYDPNAITVNYPTNESTGVPNYPVLNVTVADAESDPMDVTFWTDIVTISTHDRHSCALLKNGSAMCWGDNDYGQTGIGSDIPDEVHAPRYVNSTEKFTSICTGAGFSCGIIENESVMCWGAGHKLGIGSDYPTEAHNPRRTNTSNKFKYIACGSNAFGILENGSVMCWGNNYNDDLGTGDSDPRYSPDYINTTNKFVSIAAGAGHACGVLENGSAMCWGLNNKNQTGTGDPPPSDLKNPAYVDSTQKFVSVSAGRYTSCGVLANGSGMCWGWNYGGAAGIGSTTPSTLSSPQYVDSDNDFIQTSSGDAYSCGLLSNGSVMCWGADGALGTGDETDKHSPTYINSTENFTMISAGHWHTCGLLVNSSMMCWGGNTYGQIGLGYETGFSDPILNPSLVNTSARFYNISLKIGEDTSVASGSDAEVTLYDLYPSTVFLWSVTADDGTDIRTSLTFKFTRNLAPEINQPSFSPSSASRDDDIGCYATPTDSENQTLEVEYVWYNCTSTCQEIVRGNLTGATNATNTLITTLGSGNTSSKDKWNCSVRSFDGSDYSEWHTSQIIVGKPEITNPIFTPSIAYKYDDITCNATPSDVENDTLDIEWFLYNWSGSSYQEVFSGNLTGATNGTNTLVTTLGSGNTSVGDIWNCTVRSTDGEIYSDFASNTKLIYGKINGTITNSDESAVEDADVVAVYNTDKSYTVNTTSDASGNWILNVMYPGRYTVFGYDPTNMTKEGDSKMFVEVEP